ncbi:hypothetical protein RND71_030472 [Anisodus tanguticus]|uniref:Tryptophan synthase beta chain-like PALP domain-containing protein n=1 Tax=Anisodus tanguticus TaxID=243964 RepID=A0AAE1V7D5_9SOLA|nr:hypothetical protein RND71_030472 [Anisodus tanguticus]
MLSRVSAFDKALNLNKQCYITKSSMESPFQFLTKKTYEPPPWASHLIPMPTHTFSLGHFPTPIHKWNLPNLPKNTEVWLKRDDLSGMQLSGNKVRKLEFLLADAVAQGADCIVTIGGIQSNHCRATAVAAKYLNLDCYLILRTSKLLVDKDPGLTGNLLVERLVGAHIDLVSKEEYAKVGSEALTKLLKEKLLNEGRKPYVIPVGGSNSLGTCVSLTPGDMYGCFKHQDVAIRILSSIINHFMFFLPAETLSIGRLKLNSQITLWIIALLSAVQKLVARLECMQRGYIEAIREVEQQLQHSSSEWKFDDIIVACGSGGTVAGLSIASTLSGLKAKAKGLGYAMSSADELKFVKQVAESTGVILDPVYRYGQFCLLILCHMASEGVVNGKDQNEALGPGNGLHWGEMIKQPNTRLLDYHWDPDAETMLPSQHAMKQEGCDEHVSILTNNVGVEMLSTQAKEIFHSVLDEIEEEADFPHSVLDETEEEADFPHSVLDETEEEADFPLPLLSHLYTTTMRHTRCWMNSPIGLKMRFWNHSRCDQLINRGITDHFSGLGHASLILALHLFPPDQFGLDFPFDPGSSLLTKFLRITTNSICCATSGDLDHDKFIMSTLWNFCNWVDSGQERSLPGFLLSKSRGLGREEKIQGVFEAFAARYLEQIPYLMTLTGSIQRRLSCLGNEPAATPIFLVAFAFSVVAGHSNFVNQALQLKKSQNIAHSLRAFQVISDNICKVIVVGNVVTGQSFEAHTFSLTLFIQIFPFDPGSSLLLTYLEALDHAQEVCFTLLRGRNLISLKFLILNLDPKAQQEDATGIIHKMIIVGLFLINSILNQMLNACSSLTGSDFKGSLLHEFSVANAASCFHFEKAFLKNQNEALGPGNGLRWGEMFRQPNTSGKAAYGMMKDMSENPRKWEGRKILFIHTGGLLGLYDKADEIASSMGKWRKMDVNETIPRQDGIGKMF